MHHVRLFLLRDEIPSLVFGQAGLHLGQDLGVLAVGVKLLAGPGRARSGAGVVKECCWYISKILLKNSVVQSFLDKLLVVQQIIDFDS